MQDPYEETANAAQDGMRHASQGARAWHPFMQHIIHSVATRMPRFTMDDIRAEVRRYYPQKAPFNLMAFGPAMRKACRKGVIMVLNVPAEPSRTRSQHRGRMVYASRIFVSQPRLFGDEPANDGGLA